MLVITVVYSSSTRLSRAVVLAMVIAWHPPLIHPGIFLVMLVIAVAVVSALQEVSGELCGEGRWQKMSLRMRYSPPL